MNETFTFEQAGETIMVFTKHIIMIKEKESKFCNIELTDDIVLETALTLKQIQQKMTINTA